MNLKATLVVLALALLQTAQASSLRASSALATGSAALAKASSAVDTQARRLQEGAGLGDIKGALDAINTSIDIFNKISDIVIDRKAVDDATNFITSKQDELIKYGSEAVTASLQQLAACGVAQSQTAQRIKTMALTLSKNSANTQVLLAHVSNSTGAPDATSRKMLSASLMLLSSTLKTAVSQSSAAVGAFEALESQATQLRATLQGAALHFKAEQDDASSTMQQAQDDVREQAYITCAGVCAATAGLGCACFAAAVPIVEAKIIPDLKAKLQAFSESMDQFQSAFSAFGTVAAGYASVAKSSVAALGDYVSVVSSAESFVDATSDVDVAIVLVDNYNAQLSDIANATAILIAKIPAA